MKRFLFIGACEKTDLMLYISKVLTAANLKVLLVDATLAGKYRYSISLIDENAVLTEFDGIDVAVGFKTFNDLGDHLKKIDEDPNDYDVLLIDSDHPEGVAEWGEMDSQALVTSFEKYSVLQNVKLIERFFQDHMTETRTFLRIYYPFADCQINEAYIDSTLDRFPIQWHELAFDFLVDEVDYSVRVENQYENQIRLRGLSGRYKTRLGEICEALSGLDRKTIKRALKQAERNK